MATQKISFGKSLLEGALAGVLALVLFGPIVGLLLKGYELQSQWQRPLVMAAIVAVGRIVFSLAAQTEKGKALLQRCKRRDAGVGVAAGEKGKLQRLVVPLIIAAAVALPFAVGKYWLTVPALGLIYVLLGLGLNILVGSARRLLRAARSAAP